MAEKITARLDYKNILRNAIESSALEKTFSSFYTWLSE